MEVQVEVSHAKSDRRNGIIAAVVIHAVIILVLIWAVLPKTDPPMEELSQGMEIGLGEGLEGEGAAGSQGGGEPQPSQVAADAAANNSDPNETDDMITNEAEEPIKVAPKTNSTKTKTNTTKTNTATTTSTNTTTNPPKNPFDGYLNNNTNEGGNGNASNGNGTGTGTNGNKPGGKGNGNAASTGGGGKAKFTRSLNVKAKDQHNCHQGGNSNQHVIVKVDKNGRVKSAKGNGPKTQGSKDECFKLKAEQYVKDNYIYDECPACTTDRTAEEMVPLVSTDQ
jgi:hypothetical protein